MFLSIRSTLANAISLKIRAVAPLIMHVIHREGMFAHGVDKTREQLHTIIEPIPEAIESMLNKIFCCTKIEPRIDCIPHQPSLSTANCGPLICYSSASGARAGEQTFVDDTLKPWSDNLSVNCPSDKTHNMKLVIFLSL